MRILLVEDEVKMASFIVRGLKEEGYAVDAAEDGEKGWEYVLLNEYDLIILDLNLPKMSGMTLCSKIRKKELNIPVLMLTARDSLEDKIKGLDQGADDYLTKPFAFDELLARIRALLRRPGDLQKAVILESGHIKVDLLSRRVWVQGDEVGLSQKEFALLEFLMRKKGEVVTRSQIAEHVWDLHFDPMSNTIDVYINFLRKKIDKGRSQSMIETMRGAGYRFINQ
ncbi:MAG: response regulator transcription factor [Candidatus Omnitrophica bacterium]|nr:response regulator transcription factor [Candidatus Omnitrophota bacterium]